MHHLFKRMPPLALHLISLAAGIITAYYIKPPVFISLGACVIMGACFVHHYSTAVGKGILVQSFIWFGGYYLLTKQVDHYHALITSYQSIPCECVGRVVDYAYLPHLMLRHKLVVKIDSLQAQGHYFPFSARGYSLIIHTQQSLSHVVGSSITLKGIVIKPVSASFSLFCIRNSIIASLHKKVLEYTVIHTPRWSCMQKIHRYKQTMLMFFKHNLNYDTFTLFSALFLGNSTLSKKKIKQFYIPFQHWGIIHYLARSGLHLVMITSLLKYCLLLVPLPFSLGQGIILICSLIYWALTWASVSFYRALCMFIITLMVMISRRPHHFLHILFLTCFIFLCLNPITLFFLDFQLTFGITIALGLFNYASFKPFV